MKFFWNKVRASGDRKETDTAIPRRRVLVVEDDATTRQLISRLLVREGYDVTTVADGADALIEAKRFSPDAMILDLILPDTDPGGSQLDGFGLLRWLQMRLPKFIPTIVLTCREDEESRRLANSLGVRTYLTKPFRAQELMAAISSALAGG